MKEQTQLITLYNKWKKDPKVYGYDMAKTIDNIIFSTLHKQSLEPIYRRYEDKEDLNQELRLHCFQILNRINISEEKYQAYLTKCKEKSEKAISYESWCNKTIFNYLRISTKFFLKDKTRKVGKQMDREVIENSILSERLSVPNPIFCYGDELLDNVATLLGYGETRQNICIALNITKSNLTKQIERLKLIYNEKK